MAKATSTEQQATPANAVEPADNLHIWDKVQQTDPNYTKGFNRAGGFKGTSTNATYLAKRATEVFGPCGTGWGIKVLKEEVVEGHPFVDNGVVVGHAKVHVVHAQLWYMLGDKRGEIEQFGQTEMVGRRNDGKYFTDEEAPKKSLTDAMTKCLSLLGFAADIHLGLYDDNKYVNDLRELYREDGPRDAGDQRQQPQQEQPRRAPQRDGGPKLSVDQHKAAMKNAQTEEELKRAFALAWKQYENPNDPKVHTMAQVQFKSIYDEERKRVIPPTDEAQPPLPMDNGDGFEETLQ